MTSGNMRIVLASRPVGMPTTSNFRAVTDELPKIAAGEVLVETLFLSLDPYMRGRMSDARNYAAPVEIGEVMVGGVVGRVVESKHPAIPVGDVVESPSGWQSFAAVPGSSVRKIDSGLAPVSTALGALGMPGLTAYFATFHVGQPIAGDTVVVSGAGGAVGQLAGQFARIAGCRVVGIAGDDRKLDYCRTELGFDAVINYKSSENLKEAVARACPQGVNVYLDGVGGDVSAAVNENLALRARIVIFGQISQSNLVAPELGPRSMRHMLTSRARAEGFLIGDWQPRAPEALARIAVWLKSGKVQVFGARRRRPGAGSRGVHWHASGRKPRQDSRQG